MLKIITRLLLKRLKINEKFAMGTFLDKPSTEKYNEHGDNKTIKYGISTMQGWRVRMEDSHCACLGLPNGLNDWAFFGLFDGHAGGFVSSYLAENLLNSILECKELKESIERDPKNIDYSLLEKSIKDAFLQIDEKLKTFPKLEKGEDKSGSTAVAVIISPTHFIFINCGDSRAVLSRSNACFYSTDDHKPSKPNEKARIIKAGGSVLIQRVNGSLAVSRALGDFDYKNNSGKHPFDQLVSPEPDIRIELRDPTKDEFIILACDGIWDVMSSDDICKYVRNRLEVCDNLESVCNQVVDTCLQKGSRDNMSIILVTLDASPQLNSKAIEDDTKLNQSIDLKIKEICETNPTANMSFILQELERQEYEYPPGGGISSKHQIIQTSFNQHSISSNTTAATEKEKVESS
ncbi:protein phosphatase 1B-like [Gordionus sp. m RMFG-2023]|uniref:protein phosphatase 1B-like n=1 Tax=Gordionus sp. m RMFG-2023 TaxID=3053472 RepID=UPI0031FC145F